MKRFMTIASYSLIATLFLGNTPLRAEEPAAAPASAAAPAKAAEPAKPKKLKKSRKPKSTIAKKDGGSMKLSDANTNSKKSSMDAWLKRMKKRITSAQAKHNKIIAVAAVRGSEAPETPPLYWKGKKGKAPVEMPELQEFDSAIDAAINSDTPSAKSKLQGFIAAHPASPLAEDAQQTLDLLNQSETQP